MLKLPTALCSLLLVSTALAAGGPHEERPPRPITGAKAAFQEAAQKIRDEYVDAGISEDELWTGAINGMLDRLIQTKGKKVNGLLDPEQLRDMKEGMRGSVTGVGVAVKLFEGVVFVERAIPGSPAEAAGIKPGDRLLAVDNKPLKGMNLPQIVELIRGPERTTVDLLVQRDQNEWKVPLTRKTIAIRAVSSKMLDQRTAYLRLLNFNESTASEIDTLFESTFRNATSIVLDLRGCPGGILDAAVGVADRFLEPGKKVVSLRDRQGKEDVKSTTLKNRGDHLPVVVIIDRETASGAEILAAALAEHGRAQLVGEPTLGKSTVERIIALKSGWAMKLSVARFYSPNGNTWKDKGVTPDFAVAMPALEPDQVGELDKDSALAAALKVLELDVKK